jgi:uncharacterized CHY-type Zn-finger protein
MKSESIVFNGTTFRRYPESKRRSDRVYFTPGIADKKKGFGRLHEEIWKHANGPIPEGFHIHHIDHDPLNNSLSNLESIPAADHHRHHSASEESQERLASEEWQDHLSTIRPMAAAWHSTPEGIEWHREHGKKVAAERPVLAGKCEQCGDAFLSKMPDRFCSNKCKSAWRRDSGLDDVERVCGNCGNTFTVNKYRKTTSCSRTCAWALRRMT